jgi:hypothetical protein
MVGVLIADLVAVTPVAAAVQTTTTTAYADPATMAYGVTFTVHATVSADGPASDGSSPYGTVKVWWVYSAPYRSLVGSAPLAEGETQVSIPNLTLPTGANTVGVEFVNDNPAFSANSGSGAFVVTVGPAPSTMTMSGPTSAELHEGFNLVWTLTSPNHDSGGMTQIFRVGSPTALCTSLTGSQAASQCTVWPTTTGTFEYYGTYSGGDRSLGTTSNTVAVNVTPDALHASGLGVEYSTFYPVTDGYRDTVKIKGFREELITTTIRIYTSGGTLLKTQVVSQGIAAYAWAWNGRRSDGTIYPEATYRVVQTLVDAYGVSKAFTSYVTLSKKKLIWHAASQTKYGSSFSASGHTGAGTVAVNTTYHYVRLRAPDPYAGDWAGAGWQFSLVSGVAYRYVVVKVYAKHGQMFQDPKIGAQNFTTCPYSSTGAWSETCFGALRSIGTGTNDVLRWYQTYSLPSVYRYGRTVRSMVTVRGGTVYVYKAAVSYQYATLGY